MTRRRNNRKRLWWGGGVVLVAIVVIIGVVIWQNSQNNNQNNQNEASEVEKIEQKDELEVNNPANDENKDKETVNKPKVVQYEGGDPNIAEELSGVVTYAGVNSGVLMVRTNIDQYLTEGICELTLTRGGTIIYSDTTNIVGDVSTATCEGFDIPVSGLGEGNLEINIKLTSGGKTGTLRGEVSI